MKKADIAEFYRRLAERTPNPATELESGNTYQLLVAVVLSAQATDAGVNRATRDLFRKVTTPQQMLALGEEGLKPFISSIGLYNTKAKKGFPADCPAAEGSEFGIEVHFVKFLQ